MNLLLLYVYRLVKMPSWSYKMLNWAFYYLKIIVIIILINKNNFSKIQIITNIIFILKNNSFISNIILKQN